MKQVSKMLVNGSFATPQAPHKGLHGTIQVAITHHISALNTFAESIFDFYQ
jgi:hypothetical protein